jgi:hypothetical protein
MTTTDTTTLQPSSTALRGATLVGTAIAKCIAPWLLLAPPAPVRREQAR